MRIKNHVPCAYKECGSSDAAEIYNNIGDDGKEYKSAYCWSCDRYIPPKLVKEFYGENFEIPAEENIEPVDFTPILQLETRGYKERYIGMEVSSFYGVRTSFGTDGSISGRYYPITKNGELVGFKKRCIPKDFFSIGTNSSKCQLFGQSLFSQGGKFLTIVGGEEDCLAMHQALKKINPQYPHPVVSPTTGEANLAKQIRANYEWVSSFEKVVIIMDNDDVGQKAAEEAAKILRPGQAHLVKLRLKDPNKYIEAKLDKELVDAWWRAERYSPAGIVASSQTYDVLLERAIAEKVSLPAFSAQLQEMLNGGPALQEITTIAGASGIGKSAVTYEFLYHWVMNSSYRVGVIPLESDIGELTENLLSLHIGKKLSNMPDEEKLQYLKTSHAREAHKTLTLAPSGEDRYVIVDHQGDVADGELQSKMEYLVKVCGCKLIILDPMTLALSGGGNSETDAFMAWLLRFVKREKISHVNVVHVRKNQGGAKANSTGADIHEESIRGSGSQFQVSMNNILLMRDKENPDPTVRNTTKVVLSKARRTGRTGPAGYWFYNNNTSRLEAKKTSVGDFSKEHELLQEAGAYNNTDPEQFDY